MAVGRAMLLGAQLIGYAEELVTTIYGGAIGDGGGSEEATMGKG